MVESNYLTYPPMKEGGKAEGTRGLLVASRRNYGPLFFPWRIDLQRKGNGGRYSAKGAAQVSLQNTRNSQQPWWKLENMIFAENHRTFSRILLCASLPTVHSQ